MTGHCQALGLSSPWNTDYLDMIQFEGFTFVPKYLQRTSTFFACRHFSLERDLALGQADKSSCFF